MARFHSFWTYYRAECYTRAHDYIKGQISIQSNGKTLTRFSQHLEGKGAWVAALLKVQFTWQDNFVFAVKELMTITVSKKSFSSYLNRYFCQEWRLHSTDLVTVVRNINTIFTVLEGRTGKYCPRSQGKTERATRGNILNGIPQN